MMMIERKRKVKKNKAKRLGKLLIWMVIIVISIQILLSHIKTKKELAEKTVTPTITQTLVPLPSLTFSPTPTITNSEPLGQAIQNTLTGTQGSYGIVVENLKTGESYTSNAHTTYESGSLYKLWVMAAVFEQIQQGNLHENDRISESVVELNKAFYIDQDSAEKTSGTITYTVHDALEQMITVSDNYAALLLSEKVKLSTIALLLQKDGFSESKVGINGNAPITTPADVALFFNKLYKVQLANKTYTDEMIALLKRQKLNEKIPKYIPADISIAHKTGELDQFTHDAGIIYAPTGDYILAVLSKTESRDLANERIADVSQAVFNYFTQVP